MVGRAAAGGGGGFGRSGDEGGGTAAGGGGGTPALRHLLGSGSPSPSPMRMPGGERAPPLARDVNYTSGLLVDAGFSLGRSCRVGWGPNGILVDPRGTSSRVVVEGAAAAATDTDTQTASDDADAEDGSGPLAPHHRGARLGRLRHRLRAALELHCRHSQPLGGSEEDEDALGGGSAEEEAGEDVGGENGSGGGSPDSDGDGVGGGGAMMEGEYDTGGAVAAAPAQRGSRRAVPQWGLVVDRRHLSGLVAEYVQVCTEQRAALGGVDDEAEVGRLQHEADAWRLLQVLYGHLEGDEADGEAALGEDDGDASMGGHSAPGDPSSSCATAAVHDRRAALSRWLRGQAKPRVEAALLKCRSAPEVVLQLLTGYDTAAAAGAAAAIGDSRLALLCAQAGQQASCRANAASQLKVWRDAGMEAQVDSTRLQVYRLLAGQVSEVQDFASLDWRRYLGLLLWYAGPADADGARPASLSPVTAVLRRYADLLRLGRGGGASAGAPPPPLPHYLEAAAWAGGAASVAAAMLSGTTGGTAGGTTDVHWELLRLWAETEGRGTRASNSELAGLLRGSAHSANVCDAALGWHLLTVLQAVGGTPALQDMEAPQDQVAAFLSLISQLELVGGMSEWAIYVALHIPTHDDVAGAGLAGGTRGALVSELLCRHCGEWGADEGKRRFLMETLRLPPALLADAEAVYACYQNDRIAQSLALLDGGRAREAHELVVRHVAPELFLGGRVEELGPLLIRLRPHRPHLRDWDLGAGLYDRHFELVKDCEAMAEGRSGAEEGLAAESSTLALAMEQAGHLAMAADALHARERGREDGGGPVLRQEYVQQQMVLARMAAQVHEVLMVRALATVPAGDVARGLPVLHAVLSCSCLPPDLRSYTVAAGAAHVSAFGLEAF